MLKENESEHVGYVSSHFEISTKRKWISEDKKIVSDAYSPKLFNENIELVINKLSNYIADHSEKGLELKNPTTLLQTAKTLMTSSTSNRAVDRKEKLEAVLDLYLKTGIQTYSPTAIGRQYAGVLPLAAIIDFVSAIISQPSAFYEGGQLPNIAEHIMAHELNKFIGFEEDKFAMITTSGGTLGNLTALLAARNAKYPNIWEKGIATLAAPIPAIAISEDAHYGICRAIGILGIGTSQIIRLPVNEKRQIDIDKVDETLDKAAEKGLNVFCIVASTGTTPVGAFDPINELGDLAKERNIWLHVDGAHGGSLLVSDKLRHKLKGIEKADSLVWDAHKMLTIPAACTLLFYKDKAKSYGVFNQTASYVFEKDPDIYSEFETAKQGFECTKRPMIMNLWVPWLMYGANLFAKKVEYACNMTTEAYQILKRTADFQTINSPEANILCFRYRPTNLNWKVSNFQLAIRNKLKEEGIYFISKVEINEVCALRVVFNNHETTSKHFYQLLDSIRKIGQALVLDSSKVCQESLCLSLK